MGDREQPQFNRILAKKWERKLSHIHQQKLNDIKTTLNIQAPQEFSHLNDRKKSKQKWMGKCSSMMCIFISLCHDDSSIY